MAYTALYRRLRPRTFKEVIGQEHIIKTLVNEMKTDSLSHAYLFCGTRGTGKTSTAKIFAKAVNCLDLQDGEPCGKCHMCISADNGTSTNVIELDAASHNGVDNIREIRDEVKYTPASGKYKVYIIDEVHMLSVGAFNALLKTLEEPPSHVIFILATTDPQKIPVTILSRCQRFDFRRITPKDIVCSLKEFSKSENLKISEDALFYIANLCEGAMRDALTILDRCLAYYYNEEITLEKVLDVCGSVDNEVFFRLTDALISYDSTKCIKIINDVFEKGRDIVRFSEEFVTHLRNELISSQTENDNAFAENTYNKYKEQAAKVTTPILVKYITSFSELNTTLKLNKNPKTLVEVQCIRLCNAFDDKTAEDIFNKLKHLENTIAKGVTVSLSTSPAPAKQETAPKKIPLREKVVPKEMKEIKEKWTELADKIEKPLISSMIKKEAHPETLEDSKLYIVSEKDNISNMLKENKDLINEKMGEVFGKTFNLDFITEEKYKERNNNLLSREANNTIEELSSLLNGDLTITE